jgi:hypothetical protein
MSKMDALRAMREQRYEQATKRGGSAGARRRPPPAPAVHPAPVAPPETGPDDSEPPQPAMTAVEACGHKNMGGRTCTRPRGHAEKSHRYG